MARNIRNMSVKVYTVDYGVVENGQLKQYQTQIDTTSERRILSVIAQSHNVKPSSVVIIRTTEQSIDYQILDVIAAMDMLQKAGLAEVVTDADTDVELSNDEVA